MVTSQPKLSQLIFDFAGIIPTAGDISLLDQLDFSSLIHIFHRKRIHLLKIVHSNLFEIVSLIFRPKFATV